MSDLSLWARSIGESIRRLRRAQGMTQSDLAGDLFSKSYISQLERGSVIPSLKAIYHLAKRLGVTPLGLLESQSVFFATLLKKASVYFFLGDHRNLKRVLQDLDDQAPALDLENRCQYHLLHARVAAHHKDWASVIQSCRNLEKTLASSAFRPARLLIPQHYWWGKAWLEQDNLHQAVRRWETGLMILEKQSNAPNYEGLLLMADLAELYERLGDHQSCRNLRKQTKAASKQLTSTEDLSRWILARLAATTDSQTFEDRPKNTRDPDLTHTDHVSAAEELAALQDAEAWAQGLCILQLAKTITARQDDS